MTEARFRQAVPDDAAALTVVQSTYYAEDAYPFNAGAAGSAWDAILSEDRLGHAWLAEADSALVAYVVLTLGYSLEYRGRDAFLDELYVVPGWRGRGLGRRALELVEVACVQLSVKALHLEVERSNAGAQALYRKWGFKDRDRFLMTKLTTAPNPRGDVERGAAADEA